MSEITSFAAYAKPGEQRQLGRRIRPTNHFVPFDKEAINRSIPARFEQQVSQYADRIAIKARDKTFTYGVLNQAANRLARAILAHQGQGEEAIALLFGHGAVAVSAMLGVLKAGKFYLPLDPSYPRPRIAYMLEDAQAGIILTDSRHLALAHELAQGNRDVINVDDLDVRRYSDENLSLSVSPDTLAYILYTSGSTGQPKGVVHNHRNVLYWTCKLTNSRHTCFDDRVSLLASFSSAASVSHVYTALLNGAALYPYDVRDQGLAPLADWLRQEEITTYQSTPTVFRHFAENLIEKDVFPKVRLINLGGEATLKRDVELYRKHFSPHCLLRVSLASTEAQTISENFVDKETEINGSVVPPGYVAEDVEVLLWDENGAQVGANQIGEIIVKGRYLSLGYWRRPDLTQAAFQPDPDGGDARLYRTGDLGQILPDGTLVHLGRIDQQVKIRGYRVEVAEIEAALYDFDTIKEAVVVAREGQSGDRHLVAYVVPSSQPASTVSELRSALAEMFPDHMIPSAFVMLEKLPLTPTGKVDRRALPAPDTARPELEGTFVAPRDELELRLTKIWEKVLGIHPIGVRDNFFELGGHSLLAMRLFAQIEKMFGKKLPLATLFQTPTVEQIADVLRQECWSTPWSSLVAIQLGGSKPPFFCVPGILGNVFTDLGDLAWHLGSDQPFYGLQDGLQNPSQIEALAAHYAEEIRTVQSEGPYLLGGVCSGGVVAFEMAQQLQAQGQQVALLALVEPTPPWVPGLRSYLNFAVSIFRRMVRRFGHHSRNVSQLGFVEQGDYIRLKAKFIANSWALRRYAPQPYPGQIHLFLGSESLGSQPDPRLGWRELATGGAEIHVVPGTHDAITRTHDAIPEESHLQVLAEQLRVCIDDALTIDPL